MGGPDSTLRDRFRRARLVQDARGRFDSRWQMYSLEFEDGSDTLNRFVDQAWCDGITGMCGGSHEAQDRWSAVVSGRPDLKVLAPPGLDVCVVVGTTSRSAGCPADAYAVDMDRRASQGESIKGAMQIADQQSAKALPCHACQQPTARAEGRLTRRPTGSAS